MMQNAHSHPHRFMKLHISPLTDTRITQYPSKNAVCYNKSIKTRRANQWKTYYMDWMN